MKNVIFLVCDGLSYDMTIDLDNHKTPMKFLKKLKENSLVCKKAFSQGPYTEAGIMGLMYGRNPLEKGAYLSGMQEWEGSVYKLFHDAGYNIFTSYFGSHTPPELMIYGQYVYAQNYLTPYFSRYLKGKLDYYVEILKNTSLDIKDVIAIKIFLQNHFNSMLLWHSNLAEKNDFTGEYQPCIPENEKRREYIKFWKKEVEREYNKFCKNYKTYIENIFKNYKNHFLTTNCDVIGLPLNSTVINQRKWVGREYKELFKEIKIKNRRYFLKNNQIPYLEIIKSLKNKRQKTAEYVYRTYQACNCFDISKMVSINLPQICSSSRAFIRSFKDWNNLNKENSNPFFVYLHFDEFHRPLSFYSQDIMDRELIKNEMREASNYVSSLSQNYKGNIGFDLAAQYIDSCIEELYSYLQKENLLDNTILVITADHGSSNFGGEIRHTLTNNFYPEQYHIPLIIHGLNEVKELNSYVDIKDIPYTILKKCNLKIPNSFSGKNILDKKGTSTCVEYLGTGVPDLLRRPVLYQYRDDNIAYLIQGDLEQKKVELLEVYDLAHDQFQHKNIVKKIDRAEKENYILKFCNRLKEIKEDYENWCLRGEKTL